MVHLNLTELRQYKTEILALCQKYHASNVRIFGSVARGDNREDSDVDFLIEFEPQCSLFDSGGLLMDLQDLLDRKVDIVDEQALRPRFREQILRESVPL
jgi:hypothetical protein